MTLGRDRFAHREGWLCAWHDTASDVVGHGEAAPAYWIGEDGIDAIEEEFSSLPADGRELAAALDAGELRASAALYGALDTALLDLRGRLQGVPLWRLLGGSRDAEGHEEIAALITAGERDAVHSEVAARVREGFRVVKLKVGGDVRGDIERVAAARDAGEGRILLRLDANRSWEMTEAVEVLAAVAAPDIEYVEEPLRTRDPVALARFRARVGVPIAMDESVSDEAALTRVVECGGCDTLVIKLARVGGPRKAVELARQARRLGVRVAVTDSIETSVGRAAALHVAAALPAPRQAVGLGGALLLDGEPTGVDAVPATSRLVPCGPGIAVRAA